MHIRTLYSLPIAGLSTLGTISSVKITNNQSDFTRLIGFTGMLMSMTGSHIACIIQDPDYRLSKKDQMILIEIAKNITPSIKTALLSIGMKSKFLPQRLRLNLIHAGDRIDNY